MTTGPSTGTHAPAAPARPNASDSLIIWLLVGSAFVMILNETIMSVALPALIVDLQVSASTAQWLTSGFLLTMAVVIPITGFLLQRFPARSVYLASMTLFSAGTLLAALAPGFAVLLVARVVQATGTAVMVPLLMTTVLTLIPAHRRGQTMGTISIVIAVAPAVGPTISGVILSSLGWRWMFWIVLPIALIALACGATWLRVAAAELRRVPLDVASVVLSAVGFAGLVFGLSSIGEAVRGGSGGLPPWVPVVVGAVALTVFVLRQLRLQRRDAALLDLRPFAHRSYTLALIQVALGFTALFGGLILLPLYLQEVLGRTAFVTGLVVLPGGLAMGLLGPIVGRLYDRLGARPLVLPGSITLCASLWMFTTLGETTPLWEIVAIHVVLMGSLALMFTPLMTDGLGALPAHLYSHGSAILTTLQQVAGAAGTALFITVMTLGSAEPDGGIDIAGLRAAFTCAAVISVVVVVVAVFAGRSTPARVAEPERTSGPAVH